MRPLLILAFGFLAITSFGQKSQKVELNWKIAPDETISYQTIMNEIDTSRFDFELGDIFKSIDDSSGFGDEAHHFLKKINEAFSTVDLISKLTNNGKGVIDIVLQTRPKEDVEETKIDTLDEDIAEMMKMMQSMNDGVMLRGSVYETGEIHSFWVKTNQKNLIALFFELPAEAVKIGDSWELEINLIANDQNFVCDSSYKINKVTLIDIKEINGETIAVLKYEIVEYVNGTFNSPSFFGGDKSSTNTMMSFTHQAIGEFSVDKGRWISYEGVMGLESSGFMDAYSFKKFSLIEEK